EGAQIHVLGCIGRVWSSRVRQNDDEPLVNEEVEFLLADVIPRDLRVKDDITAICAAPHQNEFERVGTDIGYHRQLRNKRRYLWGQRCICIRHDRLLLNSATTARAPAALCPSAPAPSPRHASPEHAGSSAL